MSIYPALAIALLFSGRFGDERQGGAAEMHVEPPQNFPAQSPHVSAFAPSCDSVKVNALFDEIDDVDDGFFWLFDIMKDYDGEFDDYIDGFSGEPMDGLADAIQVYRNAGGTYNFRVPFQGLQLYLDRQPEQEDDRRLEQEHEVLSAIYYTNYNSYIGPDLSEVEQNAIEAVRAAVEEGAIKNADAFAEVYALTVAWENGLGDRFQE